MSTILIVEDSSSVAQSLEQNLRAEGYTVICARDGEEGIVRAREEKVDLVVTDLKLPKKSGLDLLATIREQNPLIPVILISAYGTVEVAVKAVKEGAYDFLSKPVDPDELLARIEKALETQRLRTENIILREEFAKQLKFPRIIGKSRGMLQVVENVKKVASSQTTVLLLGESGTGKELFARAIHALSPRAEGPFVAINCAAIPSELLESELFGHERGAFTGAIGRKIGKFELANRGTIFLDEIGDMSLALQSKLLRVLEGYEVMRVGGVSRVKIDVRVVAATNKDLGMAIAQGKFREDLYYRLSVFPIFIPPLRERREDIPLLVDHFLTFYCKEMKKESKTLSPDARDLLHSHRWTGNVRELQNCIERAVILSDGTVILPEHLGIKVKPIPEDLMDFPMTGTLQEVSATVVRFSETRMIKKALREAGGNKTKAAEILQVSYKTLLTKIKEYGIEKEEPVSS